MLIWDTVEVGRNDAANIVNAVYGARLMTRQRAATIAGLAVIVGAMLAGGVIETARKGIFNPAHIGIYEAVAIYVSVYVVDTVLLYGYSAFGMPVSTTACLVFELLGASFAISLIADTHGGVVKWANAGKVVSAIIMSIFLSGFSSYLIQRIVRGAIRDRTDDLTTMRLHGTWIGGGMATGLTFFMLLKGMKSVPVVKHARSWIDGLDQWLRSGVLPDGMASSTSISYGMIVTVLGLWLAFGLAIALSLRLYQQRAARMVFPVLAVLGMLAMAVAFGQNDLANCAAPGLATLRLLQNWDLGTAGATELPIPKWGLLACGALLFMGMRTRNATRVTKAEVNMGSHADRVRLYAPRWCLALGQLITQRTAREPSLAPEPEITPKGKRAHYDPLRASTIMCVSASVIALASSLKYPVSTTYVTFAAVVGSGLGDRIFARGDAALKMARAIWVVSSWFISAAIAALFTAIVCTIVYYASIPGLIATLACNLFLRGYFKKHGDAQSRRTREEMLERQYPERFATEDA